jgi:hypothetical protein
MLIAPHRTTNHKATPYFFTASVRQGEVPLALRALLLEVRGALNKDVRVGMGAHFLGPAPRREPGQITGRRLLAISLAVRRSRATRA